MANVIRYPTGEVAQVGDRVLNHGWESVVDEVIDTPERIAFWGVKEPGLMLKCKEAGLVFEPCSNITWDHMVFKGRKA